MAVIAACWAAAWVPVGVAWALIQGLRFRARSGFLPHGTSEALGRAAFDFGIWGALGGIGFALALMLAMRRAERGLGAISVWRGAALGALGALGVPLLYAAAAGLLGLPSFGLEVAPQLGSRSVRAAAMVGGFMALGAGASAAIIAIARRPAADSIDAPVHAARLAPRRG
ncbi:MAG TPA: hypothetical protein VEA99_18530 [Gemmatimonadaceae bacterium]|nr:hypothetical protein [Gemmatimonadaceae bacterium]